MREPDIRALMAADDELGDGAMRALVRPFYLALMGFGGLSVDEGLVRQVARASRRVDGHQVRLMLRGTWRPLVMGAWFAIACEDPAFSDAVHGALGTCRGHLTAPPLIAATVLYPSSRTVPLLLDYAATDRLEGWGAGDLADAAAQRLTASSGAPSAAQEQQSSATRQLDALVALGLALREGPSRGWPRPGGLSPRT